MNLNKIRRRGKHRIHFLGIGLIILSAVIFSASSAFAVAVTANFRSTNVPPNYIYDNNGAPNYLPLTYIVRMYQSADNTPSYNPDTGAATGDDTFIQSGTIGTPGGYNAGEISISGNVTANYFVYVVAWKATAPGPGINYNNSTPANVGSGFVYTYRPASFSTTLPVTVPGTIQFSAATYTVAENGVTATITATRTGGSSGAVGISYATSNGTATSGSDYTSASGTLSWADGDTANKTFTVPVTDDSLDESDETVNLTLSSPTGGATLGGQSTAALTITDNDAAPTVAFTSAAQSSVGESGAMTITAQLSAASGLAVTVPYTMSGTATGGGTDYSITASPITITAGSLTGTATITITGDTLDENNETVIATMGSPTNATASGITVHTATITDDDTAPTVAFTSAAQNSAGESGAMTITAQLSTASGLAVTVPYTVSGTATGGGTDYTITASPITITAGSLTGTATITIVSDVLVEGNETVIATMGSPTNATASGITVHTATITDDDAAVPGTIQFSAATYTVAENGVTATITATRTVGSNGAVGISYATSNGTATSGSDYTSASGTLSWADGDTANKTFTVPITNDVLVEGNETVNLTLSSPTGGATLGGQNTAVLTITDDDAAVPGTIQFSAATYTVAENGVTATITATRTVGSNGAVGISYATSNGTATSGSDYTSASGTLSWADGDTANKTFTVPVTDDSLDESDETVNLTLSLPTGGATLGGQNTAALTITDDDAAPTVAFTSAAQSSVGESGAMTITAQLSAASGLAVTVPYTVSGTATGGGTDYTITASPITITAGSLTGTATITIVSDVLVEGNETVIATMGVPTNATASGITVHTATITDDDTAGPSSTVVIDDYEIHAGTDPKGLMDYYYVSGSGVDEVTIPPLANSTTFQEGARSMQVRYPGAAGSQWGGYWGGGLNSGTKDLTLTNGVSLWVKGDGLDNRVRLDLKEPGVAGETYSSTSILLNSTSWQEVQIPFSQFTRDPYGYIGDGVFSKIISGYTLVYVGADASATDHYIDYIVAKVLPPTVTFTSAAQSSANESGTMTITAQLSAASGLDVVVPYTMIGTATSGTDYTITASPITIAAGSTTGTATITVTDDLLVEGNETVIVTMGSPTNAVQGATTVHTATITDDDFLPTVTSVSPNSGVNTGTTNITITGTNLTGATAVNLGTTALTPYTVVNSTTITTTVPAGLTAGTYDITVTTAVGTSAISPADQFTVLVLDPLPPVISNVTFDDKLPYNGDLVANRPTIKATITDDVAVDTSSITVEAGSTYGTTTTPEVQYDSGTGQMSISLISALPAGEMIFRISAKDTFGNSATYSITLKVAGEGLYIDGNVFNYPNPFNPLTGPTKIGFNISMNGPVDIYIFDTNGRIIVKKAYAAIAGYNEVEWSGVDDFGDMASNGVYMVKIVGDGRVLGKTKVWVIKK